MTALFTIYGVDWLTSNEIKTFQNIENVRAICIFRVTENEPFISLLESSRWMTYSDISIFCRRSVKEELWNEWAEEADTVAAPSKQILPSLTERHWWNIPLTYSTSTNALTIAVTSADSFSTFSLSFAMFMLPTFFGGREQPFIADDYSGGWNGTACFLTADNSYCSSTYRRPLVVQHYETVGYLNFWTQIWFFSTISVSV